MEPGTAMAAAAIAAQIGSSLLGASASKKAAKAQEAAAREALEFQRQQVALAVAELEKIGIPPVEAMQIVLQSPEVVGLEDVVTLDPSAWESFKVDPALVETQRKALTRLGEYGESGLSPAEQAARDQMFRSIGSEQQAAQQSILRNAQARGMSGSGAELIAQLQGTEAAANRRQMAGEELMKSAEQRAMDAIMKQSSLAGSLREQEMSEFGQKANARDAINRFNVANQMDVNLRNLNRRQAAEEARIGAANEQMRYNKGLLQQDYQNRLNRANSVVAARTGATPGIATSMQSIGQANAARQAAMGNAISQAGNTIGASLLKYALTSPSSPGTPEVADAGQGMGDLRVAEAGLK